MTDLKVKILNAINEIAEQRGAEIQGINDETVLLESGLDSLGFAILVVRLEEELGYDPFVMMDQPVYPRTLAEFVDVYKHFAPK
jgi:hypothetical protein